MLCTHIPSILCCGLLWFGVAIYGYQFETQLKLKLPANAFAYNLSLICQIVLKFCTEHAMLRANFRNHMTNKTDVLDEWIFTKFEFNMSFGWYVDCTPNVIKTQQRINSVFVQIIRRIINTGRDLLCFVAISYISVLPSTFRFTPFVFGAIISYDCPSNVTVKL